MSGQNILGRVRQPAGLSQAELAQRSGTSRPTLSAYEHGRKSPTLATAARIVAAPGCELTITPRIQFRQVAVDRGRPFVVPTELPRLPLEQAPGDRRAATHLNWSDRGRRYDLRDRRQRARVYEIVLREGGPGDVLRYVDGAHLVDHWNDLVLPAKVRAAWEPVVTGQSVSQVASWIAPPGSPISRSTWPASLLPVRSPGLPHRRRRRAGLRPDRSPHRGPRPVHRRPDHHGDRAKDAFVHALHRRSHTVDVIQDVPTSAD